MMIVFQDTALADTTVVGSLEIQTIALIYVKTVSASNLPLAALSSTSGRC
jgi:hypothetical protein